MADDLSDGRPVPAPDFAGYGTATQMDAAAMAEKARTPCPRCRGRMLASGTEGDLACFACGHRIYRLAPPSDLRATRRRASHAGRKLD